MIKLFHAPAMTILFSTVVFLTAPTPLKAESVTEIYGGVGFTQKHNAMVTLPNAGITGTHESLKFNSAIAVGGRVMYWNASHPFLGFGLDASHFSGPDQPQQSAITELCVQNSGCSTSPENIEKFNNNVTVIGLDAMLRYPLFKSEQFKKGQLQPYLTVGPAVFISTMKDTGNFIPPKQSSGYTSVGVKAGAGVNLFFNQNLGAFLEYRDTSFQVKDTFQNDRVVHTIKLGKTLGTAHFNIQTVVLGVAFSF